MFGMNEITGKKFFTDQPEENKDKLMVTSRFMTLQGEGPYAGIPALFVRLAKCQLSCSFCDTFFDDGTWYTKDELLDDIDKVINKFFYDNVPNWALHKFGYVVNTKNEIPYNKSWVSFQDKYYIQSEPRRIVLVITGGEPSLQSNLYDLLDHVHMNNLFYKTQIESNGLLPINLPEKTTLVISPKCLEKDGKALHYREPHPKNLSRADCLKFVMCADTSSPYSSIPDWAREWANNTGKEVFVSPMNIYRQEPQKAKELRAKKEQQNITIDERSEYDEVVSFWEKGLLDMPENKKNHEFAANYAIRNGFRFGVQMHLLASVA